MQTRWLQLQRYIRLSCGTPYMYPHMESLPRPSLDNGVQPSEGRVDAVPSLPEVSPLSLSLSLWKCFLTDGRRASICFLPLRMQNWRRRRCQCSVSSSLLYSGLKQEACLKEVKCGSVNVVRWSWPPPRKRKVHCGVSHSILLDTLHCVHSWDFCSSRFNVGRPHFHKDDPPFVTSDLCPPTQIVSSYQIWNVNTFEWWNPSPFHEDRDNKLRSGGVALVKRVDLHGQSCRRCIGLHWAVVNPSGLVRRESTRLLPAFVCGLIQTSSNIDKIALFQPWNIIELSECFSSTMQLKYGPWLRSPASRSTCLEHFSSMFRRAF